MCPKGTKLLKIEKSPVSCSSSTDCPEFHHCHLPPGPQSQSVCCGLDISDICPTKVYPAMRVSTCSLCGRGYECHKNYCCPQKEVACAQPIPTAPSEALGSPGVVLRYYYDSETNTCHSFEYSGPAQNPAQSPGSAQNHFWDHESCIEMCVYSQAANKELQCPHPYINPPDHPQMCTTALKSCSDSETCLKTTSGAFVCCQNPPSFQTLMSNLCGASYVPILNKSGNPIRCSSSSRCSSRICR